MDILKVAMMNTYKVDMAAALEHMAKCASIPTSYDNLSVASRAKITAAANKARLRKRGGNDDSDGPPDKRKNIRKGIK